ncbi:MAG: class I SAM-dependent methyltransferase [Xanthobacteraceae bacterium]
MAELFDSYDRSYGAVVQSSIDFLGLPHSFFMAAKAAVLRELIATHLDGEALAAALDVGCGVGAFHPFMHGMFRQLCGTDVSAPSLAQARRSNPDVDYKAYDGTILPYDGATFDLATAICVMHHVAPEQRLGFLREMRRVVRPGGLVCIIEHNPFNPLTRLAVVRCEFDRDAVLLRAGQTRRLMADAGLRDADTRYFALLPSVAPLARSIEHRFRGVPLGAQYVTHGIA